jgi:predicted transcriptional regulator of viral defense system
MEKDIYTKISKLPYFTRSTLETLLNIKYSSIQQYIRRYIKGGKIIRIKKGMYTTTKFIDSLEMIERQEFLEFISSIIKIPSYLSLEYVLAKHDILTEATFAFTSVTLKGTRDYTNSLGDFRYKKIKEELFGDYNIQNFRGSQYFVAKLGKALFDYIYFKSPSLPDYIGKLNLAEELRLKLDQLNTDDWEIIKKNVEIAASPKLERLFKNIFKHAHIS